MKFVIIILILVGVSCLLLFLYTFYRLYIELNLHSPAATVDLPQNFAYNTLFVTNSDYQKIAYWYFPVSQPKAVILLVHGRSVPGGKNQMLVHAQYLHNAGYSTVVMDLRSFGESDGKKITLGVNEWRDVDAVFTKIKSLPENQNKKVGLFGISMGASTVLVNAGITHKPDFVIADVPYANFDSLFHYQIEKAGFPPQVIYPFMQFSALIELGSQHSQFTPKTVVKSIKVPILFISAQQDEEVNPQDAVTLYNLANQPKELWKANTSHDVFQDDPDMFKERVLSFLSKIPE